MGHERHPKSITPRNPHAPSCQLEPAGTFTRRALVHPMPSLTTHSHIRPFAHGAFECLARSWQQNGRQTCNSAFFDLPLCKKADYLQRFALPRQITRPFPPIHSDSSPQIAKNKGPPRTRLQKISPFAQGRPLLPKVNSDTRPKPIIARFPHAPPLWPFEATHLPLFTRQLGASSTHPPSHLDKNKNN